MASEANRSPPRPPSTCWRAGKLDRPCSSKTTASPSMIALPAPSAAAADAMAGKRWVQSCPPRVMIRTPVGSTWTWSRYPSHLISNAQCGPTGALAASVARHGSTRSGMGSRNRGDCRVGRVSGPRRVSSVAGVALSGAPSASSSESGPCRHCDTARLRCRQRATRWRVRGRSGCHQPA